MKVYIAMIRVMEDQPFYPYGAFSTRKKAETATKRFPAWYVFSVVLNRPIPFDGSINPP